MCVEGLPFLMHATFTGVYRMTMFVPKLYGTSRPVETNGRVEHAEEGAGDPFPNRAPGSPMAPMIAHNYSADASRLQSVAVTTDWNVRLPALVHRRSVEFTRSRLQHEGEGAAAGSEAQHHQLLPALRRSKTDRCRAEATRHSACSPDPRMVPRRSNDAGGACIPNLICHVDSG